VQEPQQLRSNLPFWQTLQDLDYFENHPCYGGLRDDVAGDTCQTIEAFRPLTADMRVVVIGCGYGRETLDIAPRVSHVYGIDVSTKILEKARRFLTERRGTNFTPVLASRYASEIPDGIDLVFSVIVMQHLTRDLVREYVHTLGGKLSPGGDVVAQFLENTVGIGERDAELKLYEPNVNWSPWEVVELCRESGLNFRRLETYLVTPTALWHWAWFSKSPRPTGTANAPDVARLRKGTARGIGAARSWLAARWWRA